MANYVIHCKPCRCVRTPKESGNNANYNFRLKKVVQLRMKIAEIKRIVNHNIKKDIAKNESEIAHAEQKP